MMNQELRESFRFHQQHSACVIGQRAIAGLALARAELALREAESAEIARIVWEDDADPDTSWMDKRQLDEWKTGRMEILCCYLEEIDQQGARNQTASLSGIALLTYGEQNYRRTVETELALEAGFGTIPRLQMKLDL